MDSKKGLEKVMPVDAQAAGLLDPSLLWLDPDDTVTCSKDTLGNMPPKQAGSPVRSLTVLEELRKWESYCLYVRVLRDSDAILEQDQKVPEHCWNASISEDICEAWSGLVPDMFFIDHAK